MTRREWIYLAAQWLAFYCGMQKPNRNLKALARAMACHWYDGPHDRVSPREAVEEEIQAGQ